MSGTEIVLTTLETLPGMDIEEHIGIVSGSAAFSRSWIKSIVMQLKNLFGGELKGFDEDIQHTRKEAMESMLNQAKSLGANAIINIRFESSHTNMSFVEIYVYGTAVKANKY